jgi:hypothetical protein
MPAHIEAIRAKQNRALHHLKHFGEAIKAFHETKPHKIGIREDLVTGKRIYYLIEVGEVPLHVAAIAADVLQNLRAALDHIAYQSEVKGNGGVEPKHPVYFPIASDSASYLPWRTKNLKHSFPNVIAEMDSIEPYAQGKGDGLWRLHSLSLKDKHKLLISTRPILGGVDISVDLREGMREMTEKLLPGKDLTKMIPPLYIRETELMPPKAGAGDELFIEPLDRPIQKDRDFLLDVSFNHPDVLVDESASQTLDRMAVLVESVIKRFEPLLV